MNGKSLRKQWDGLKGQIRSTWEKLTESDVEAIGRSRDRLVVKIREAYGVAKEEAERQVDVFEREASSAARKVSVKVRGSLRGALKAAEGVCQAAAGVLDRASDGVIEYQKAIAASAEKALPSRPSRSRAKRQTKTRVRAK